LTLVSYSLLQTLFR